MPSSSLPRAFLSENLCVFFFRNGATRKLSRLTWADPDLLSYKVGISLFGGSRQSITTYDNTLNLNNDSSVIPFFRNFRAQFLGNLDTVGRSKQFFLRYSLQICKKNI